MVTFKPPSHMTTYQGFFLLCNNLLSYKSRHPALESRSKAYCAFGSESIISWQNNENNIDECQFKKELNFFSWNFVNC